MRQTKFLLYALAGMLLLSGCRSSKHATTGSVTPIAVSTGVKALTAKMNLTLESGKKRVSVGGTYRLKRDEVVQVNLTYTMIISINVGTLELTPDYMLVLDRMNKRYCRVRYDEVPELARAGIDFNYMQRVFWGEAEESPTRLLEWMYANWAPLGMGQFPGQIRFVAKTNSAAYQATFNLSNIREDDNWDTHVDVPSKYTPVSLDAVMKALMSVAK